MWMGRVEVELPTDPAAPGQAGLGLVARGRRCAPSPRWPRRDPVRGGTIFFGHLARPAVRRGARRGHVAVGLLRWRLEELDGLSAASASIGARTQQFRRVPPFWLL